MNVGAQNNINVLFCRPVEVWLRGSFVWFCKAKVNVSGGGMFFGGPSKESSSKLSQAVNQVQFFTVVSQKALFHCWPLVGGHDSPRSLFWALSYISELETVHGCSSSFESGSFVTIVLTLVRGSLFYVDLHNASYSSCLRVCYHQ